MKKGKKGLRVVHPMPAGKKGNSSGAFMSLSSSSFSKEASALKASKKKV